MERCEAEEEEEDCFFYIFLSFLLKGGLFGIFWIALRFVWHSWFVYLGFVWWVYRFVGDWMW